MPKYPIFPVRLRPDDRQVLVDLKDHYGLRTIAESLRLASRVLRAIKLPRSEAESIEKAYEESNPEALKIPIPPEQVET